MSKSDGGPAFPFILQGPKLDGDSHGMSLRDWFAGQALVGCLERMAEVQGIGQATFPQNCATHAYRIADAMLEARK